MAWGGVDPPPVEFLTPPSLLLSWVPAVPSPTPALYPAGRTQAGTACQGLRAVPKVPTPGPGVRASAPGQPSLVILTRRTALPDPPGAGMPPPYWPLCPSCRPITGQGRQLNPVRVLVKTPTGLGEGVQLAARQQDRLTGGDPLTPRIPWPGTQKPPWGCRSQSGWPGSENWPLLYRPFPPAGGPQGGGWQAPSSSLPETPPQMLI